MDFRLFREKIFSWGGREETAGVPSPSMITKQIEEITGSGVSYIPLISKQLDYNKKAQADKIKALYPNLVKLMFLTAQDTLEGRFGPLLQQYAKSGELIMREESMIWPLALAELSKNEHLSDKDLRNGLSRELIESLRHLPSTDMEKILLFPMEKLNDQQRVLKGAMEKYIHSMTIPRKHQETLVDLFGEFVENIAHPSHVMVSLTLQMEKNDPGLGKTTKAVMQVKRPTERSKAFAQIVQQLAYEKHSEEALTLIRSLKPKEKSSSLNSIIDFLYKQSKANIYAPESGWFEKACAEALTLPSDFEKNRMLQRLVAAASRYGDAAAAFKTANKITDLEVKAYALSSAVQALLASGRMQAALQLLPAIVDRGAKEDAITYIVKNIGQHESYEDAVAFIDTLPNVSERKHGAKVLMSLLAPKHEDKQIEALKEKYVLA